MKYLPKGKKLTMTIVVFLFWIFAFKTTIAQTVSDTTDFHELTVFIIDPAAPIHWQSPSKLYASIKKSFFRKVFHPQMRFLGHMAFCLNSDLLEEPLWMGIAPRGQWQLLNQLLIKKAGLGVLGIPFKAKIEGKQLLKRSISYNNRKNNAAFITFRINEKSAKRILDFLSVFNKRVNDKYAPSNFYGGIFWPLYENEGAGCSALCIAAMEAAGIKMSESDTWRVKLNIPLELIGSNFNNGKKIALRKIKNTKTWYQGAGIPEQDFIKFEIYDPALVMKWVENKMNQEYGQYNNLSHNNLRGLYYDYRHLDTVYAITPLKKRPVPTLFIQSYKDKFFKKN